MPENKPTKATGTKVQTALQSETFSGPLPHPDLLAKYNAVLPDAAERIMRMAEKQADHRRALEARIVGNNTFNQTLGQVFGFLLALVAIVGGLYLITMGASIIGLTSVLGALAALVMVFIKGRNSQERERTEKLKALPK